MADPDYQRQYYLRNRERRLADAKAYHQEHREEKKEYLAAYYRNNRDKYRRTPEQQAEHNARRRAKYAASADIRERRRADSAKWQRENPQKRLGQRLRAYGISVADYERLLAEQGGACAICGRVDSGNAKDTRLHVDHCHATGRVRGLLCTNCNHGLGKFADSPERIERAALYLRTRCGSPGPGQ